MCLGSLFRNIEATPSAITECSQGDHHGFLRPWLLVMQVGDQDIPSSPQPSIRPLAAAEGPAQWGGTAIFLPASAKNTVTDFPTKEDKNLARIVRVRLLLRARGYNWTTIRPKEIVKKSLKKRGVCRELAQEREVKQQEPRL